MTNNTIETCNKCGGKDWRFDCKIYQCKSCNNTAVRWTCTIHDIERCKQSFAKDECKADLHDYEKGE